jgi:hypothetical protein
VSKVHLVNRGPVNRGPVKPETVEVKSK